MANLLLELRSEEIPAAMQRGAAGALARRIAAELKSLGCSFEEPYSFSTPRRIGVHIRGLPKKLEASREEIRGPRAGAPQKAIAGFREKYKGREITQKGDYYIVAIKEPARLSSGALAERIPRVLFDFPWPKSMFWPQGEGCRWVRPLRSILCLLDGKKVSFRFGGCASGNITYGHPVDAPGSIRVASFADYEKKLRKAHIIIDAQKRAEKIEEQIKKLAGEDLLENGERIDELAALAEWPMLHAGEIAKDYADLPPEVLDVVLWKHQQCLLIGGEGKRAAFSFLTCADGSIGGKAVAAGTAWVLSARLADAKFFIEQDLKTGLDKMREATDSIMLHEKLGSMRDKSERLRDPDYVVSGTGEFNRPTYDTFRKAVPYVKADLASQVVREFPELQGIMGGYYYYKRIEMDSEIKRAIAEHHRPQSMNDKLPQTEVGQLLALADKLDTLAGFFAIGEIPTGSKDPYALRRAALGVIRIMEEKTEIYTESTPLRLLCASYIDGFKDKYRSQDREKIILRLCRFITDRLKSYLRHKGKPYDLIDAVTGFDENYCLHLIIRHADDLDEFLSTEDGWNLLTAYRRAAGILRDEEKKDKRTYKFKEWEESLSSGYTEEEMLGGAVRHYLPEIDKSLKKNNFVWVFRHLARLRAPVDAFFENVRINVADEALRRNRLCLLAGVRDMMNKVADFSRIERK